MTTQHFATTAAAAPATTMTKHDESGMMSMDWEPTPATCYMSGQSENQRKEQEKQQMNQSVTGKAWKLVEQVQGLPQPQLSSVAASTVAAAAATVTPIAVDDMVHTAERFLQAQTDFAKRSRALTDPDSRCAKDGACYLFNLDTEAVASVFLDATKRWLKFHT